MNEWTEERAIAFHDAMLACVAPGKYPLPGILAPSGPIAEEELVERGLSPRLRDALDARLIRFGPWPCQRGWSDADLAALVDVAEQVP